ncbi:hypothetical protein DPMN_121232 [Dreissena polymorpha]|uniref:Uncharacterized protein n=1 Tax=Dreissena polymorpha TaxID=45954 RepID=A0A9D4GQE1_DREPO|nr:hypothetical protein DPMN_121232 [Dreissena polymorpha]
MTRLRRLMSSSTISFPIKYNFYKPLEVSIHPTVPRRVLGASGGHRTQDTGLRTQYL